MSNDTTTAAFTTCAVRDIASDEQAAAGWWTSEDGQGQLDMTGCTGAAAVAELLTQCATDSDREAILAGTLELAD